MKCQNAYRDCFLDVEYQFKGSLEKMLAVDNCGNEQ